VVQYRGDKFGENERFRGYLLRGYQYAEALDRLTNRPIKLNASLRGEGARVVRQEEIVVGMDDRKNIEWATLFLRDMRSYGDWPRCVVLSPRVANDRV
jgi:hypothetical protein